MDLAIQVGLLLVWLPLNLLIITALLRGDYRNFPFIFAYTVVEFLAFAAEVPLYWAVYTRGQQASSIQVFVFWMDEAIAQVLIFAVVLSLLHRASEKLGTRRVVRFALTAGAVAFAIISFGIHYKQGPMVGIWMTPWTRDLNVCAAILDLALWALLLGSREKDARLLLLSGALGIQFTGEAIGESVRHLATIERSHSISLFGSTLIVTADIVRSYIWWQVFRRSPNVKLKKK